MRFLIDKGFAAERPRTCRSRLTLGRFFAGRRRSLAKQYDLENTAIRDERSELRVMTATKLRLDKLDEIEAAMLNSFAEAQADRKWESLDNWYDLVDRRYRTTIAAIHGGRA